MDQPTRQLTDPPAPYEPGYRADATPFPLPGTPGAGPQHPLNSYLPPESVATGPLEGLEEETWTVEDPTVAPGDWAIVTVSRESTLPYRCFVGEVRAVDSQHVRLRLVNWQTEAADQWDVVLPWHRIDGVICCTDEHKREGFLDYARDWAARANADAVLDSDEPARET